MIGAGELLAVGVGSPFPDSASCERALELDLRISHALSAQVTEARIVNAASLVRVGFIGYLPFRNSTELSTTAQTEAVFLRYGGWTLDGCAATSLLSRSTSLAA